MDSVHKYLMILILNKLTKRSGALNKYKTILIKINIRYIFQITTVLYGLTIQMRQNKLVQGLKTLGSAFR